MKSKRILIFDELSFARVCSALLQHEGYDSEAFSAVQDVPSARDMRRYGLIITSYPFCSSHFRKIKNLGVPTIILADDMDEDLFASLKDFDNSYCMIKPLDYEKFRSLVRRLMRRRKAAHGGFHYLL